MSELAMPDRELSKLELSKLELPELELSDLAMSELELPDLAMSDRGMQKTPTWHVVGAKLVLSACLDVVRPSGCCGAVCFCFESSDCQVCCAGVVFCGLTGIDLIGEPTWWLVIARAIPMTGQRMRGSGSKLVRKRLVRRTSGMFLSVVTSRCFPVDVSIFRYDPRLRQGFRHITATWST